MRSTTAGELTTLGLLTRTVTYRVKVANGSGTMIDLTSWVESISRNEDVDQPVAGATVSFTRANGVLQTLSPLRTDSTLNVKDDLTYAPLLDLVRAITIEVATTPIGVLPVAGDYKLKFKGRTAMVSFAGNPIVVECRDEGGELVDRWVETKKLYGSIPGVADETVMQSIHDDVFGAGVKPVWTPVSPSYLISPPYQQQYQSVMDADVALAQLPGWDVRMKWDDGTGAFRFKFYGPDRAKTVPDFTFGPSGYYDVTALELSELDIRNVIIVEYRDIVGNRQTVVVSDSASIAKYGRRPLFIIEGDDSPINTSGEATTMANAALADSKDPKAEFEITAPFCWPLELGDLDRFLPNGVHFDTAQDWAIVTITDEFSPGKHETKIKVRGSPAGQYMLWRARGGSIGGPTAAGESYAPYPYITPLNTEATESTWDLRFNAVYGSGGGGTNLTYTVKSKIGFGSETTISSGNASVFPLDLSITRHPKEDKLITFTVIDAATGMSAVDSRTVSAIRPEVDSTGNIERSRPFSDGKWAPKASDAGGGVIDVSVLNSESQPISKLLAKTNPSDPNTLDGVPEGTTYKKILSTKVNLGRPVIDFTEGIHIGQNVDNIADGTTYKKTLATRVNAGRPVIDFTEAIHTGKTVDNLADGTYAKTLATRVNTGRPVIDFTEAIHTGKNIDNIADGSTYVRTTPNEKTGAARAFGVISGDLDLLARKLGGTGSTPGISVPTGAGAMGTSPTGTIIGTDTAGFIHTIVGTSPASTGNICTITFAVPYAAAPFVVISGGSSGGMNAKAFAVSVSTTGFTVTTTSGYGGAGAVLDYYYQVIG